MKLTVQQSPWNTTVEEQLKQKTRKVYLRRNWPINITIPIKLLYSFDQGNQ